MYRYFRVTVDLERALNSAMKENGIEFIPNLNMYFNQNTGM